MTFTDTLCSRCPRGQWLGAERSKPSQVWLNEHCPSSSAIPAVNSSPKCIGAHRVANADSKGPLWNGAFSDIRHGFPSSGRARCFIPTLQRWKWGRRQGHTEILLVKWELNSLPESLNTEELCFYYSFFLFSQNKSFETQQMHENCQNWFRERRKLRIQALGELNRTSTTKRGQAWTLIAFHFLKELRSVRMVFEERKMEYYEDW